MARFQIDFHISRKFLNLKKYKETKKKFFLEFLIRFISVTTARTALFTSETIDFDTFTILIKVDR